MIHITSLVNNNVKLGQNISIGAYAIIGDSDTDEISLGDNTKVGHHSYIFGHVAIGSNCTFDAYSQIGDLCKIGDNNRFLYGTRVHYDVKIGNNCTISGNCPDRTTLGDFVIHLGKISHSFYHPFADWDTPEEPGPNIGSNVVIGTDATLIGPINIGNNCFIFPGEIVRSNIPDDSIFKDGKIKHMPNWANYLRSLGAAQWTPG